jgi:glycosyltransferase involved in cell wall biosynthesis
VIKEGVNGYLAPIGDAQTLAEGLEKVLILSSEAWQEMSDAAYQAATSYTWDDATNLFEAALSKTFVDGSEKEIYR